MKSYITRASSKANQRFVRTLAGLLICVMIVVIAGLLFNRHYAYKLKHSSDIDTPICNNQTPKVTNNGVDKGIDAGNCN